MTALSQILKNFEHEDGHLSSELQAKLRLAIEGALKPESPTEGSAGQTGPPDRLITMRELPSITGYSRRKLLDMVSKGEFVQPIRINARCNRWRLSAVMQWIDDVEAAAQDNDVPHVCNNPTN